MEDTIMKKTYIIPEMEIVKIATQQMLALSSRGLYGGEDAGTSGTGDDEEYLSL